MSMPALLIHAFSGLVAPPAGTLIVGGGPAGLATAIALAKRGYKKVEVLDRLPPPPAVDDTAWSDTARFYLIGIGGRGQDALRKIGAWDAIEPFTQPVAGRKDWAPGSGVDGGVLTVRADRPPSNVIQRDRLVSCLLAESRSLGITVRHEVDVASVRWEGGEAVLTCRPCGEEACQLEEAVEGRAAAAAPPPSGGEYELRAPFLVASDGVRRTVAAAVEAADRERRWALPGRRFKVTRFEDTSVRVYKTVPFRPPEDWRGDINYSARTAKANFDALPAPGGDYCGVLLIEPEDELTQGLPDVPSARRYFDDLLPMFSPHISDESLQAVIDKPTSRLPQFRYAGPRLHHRNTALLGDAVHSVKPYFGLGVNAAFEDVAALGQALDDSPDLPNALRAFSAKRAGEARVLVQLSRSFDLGGWRSFAFFIGPLILDGIFHGVAPSLFAPNTLAMLQKPHLSFARVRWRKRLDRTIQLAVLAAAATAAGRLAAVALGAAVRALTRASLPPAARPLLAAAPLAAAAAFALRLRQRVGGDVADVLASQVTTGSEKGERDEERLVGTRPGY